MVKPDFGCKFFTEYAFDDSASALVARIRRAGRLHIKRHGFAVAKQYIGKTRIASKNPSSRQAFPI